MFHCANPVRSGARRLSVAASREGYDSMGMNTPSDETADLQVGATDQGMVRLFVSSETAEIPMDFDPDDADAIAEELTAAAQAARKTLQKGTKR